MIALVFLMIYTMMIRLDFARLPKVLARPRPTLLNLVYSFVVTPLLAWSLVQAMSGPPELALAIAVLLHRIARPRTAIDALLTCRPRRVREQWRCPHLHRPT